ncbi:hypothetical protein PAPHI01_0186 [Pancytospora philotis]|nr:hypothetical protein PAPHI01_0186 [Pancytospora philotis]
MSVPKCKRIPISLIFSGEGLDKAKIAGRFVSTGHFALAMSYEEYFHALVQLIMDDEDPAAFINGNEPLFPGQQAVEILVSGDSAASSPDLVVYGPDMPEDAFLAAVKAQLERIGAKHRKAIEESTGLQYFTRFFSRDSTKKKELAEAYFFTGDYDSAQAQFEGVRKAYPEYSGRMVDWCSLLLGTGVLKSCYIIDVLVLMDAAPEMRSIASAVPAWWRMAVEYWLSKHKLPRGRRLLSLYSCMRNFKLVQDRERMNLYADSLLKELDDLIGSPVAQRSALWKAICMQVEEESALP